MRLQRKGYAIFGTYGGYADKEKGLVIFYDEETGKREIYHKSRLQKSYERMG
tara:strand:+ start:1175 stop:1330 length:156 start_codon:yes stop_codon:yes gene_type:complete